MARTFFPEEDPIGERLVVDLGDPVNIEVIGVVGDTRQGGLAQAPSPTFYLRYEQFPRGGLGLVARTSGRPTTLAETLRRTVWELDPDQPLAPLTTMEALVSASVAEPRFRTVLLGSFGAVALLLAAVGLYGVLSYTVRTRRREVGIRLALGARSGQVVRLVLSRGIRSTALGIAIGLAGALGLSRLLEGLLFQVEPTDPPTLAGAVLLVGLVAVLSMYLPLPARAAARVEPTIALRVE